MKSCVCLDTVYEPPRQFISLCYQTVELTSLSRSTRIHNQKRKEKKTCIFTYLIQNRGCSAIINSPSKKKKKEFEHVWAGGDHGEDAILIFFPPIFIYMSLKQSKAKQKITDSLSLSLSRLNAWTAMGHRHIFNARVVGAGGLLIIIIYYFPATVVAQIEPSYLSYPSYPPSHLLSSTLRTFHFSREGVIVICSSLDHVCSSFFFFCCCSTVVSDFLVEREEVGGEGAVGSCSVCLSVCLVWNGRFGNPLLIHVPHDVDGM